jgi:hypothetical protein
MLNTCILWLMYISGLYLPTLFERVRAFTQIYIYNTVFFLNLLDFKSFLNIWVFDIYGYWVVDTNYHYSQIKWEKMCFIVMAVYQQELC